MVMDGYSKLNKEEKLDIIRQNLKKSEHFIKTLRAFEHPEEQIQKILDEISENAISNYHLPFSIAPNFLINEVFYWVPMVIEESSVVAAASSAAKFWAKRGGFQSRVISTTKVGHVHFLWKDKDELLKTLFPEVKEYILQEVEPITRNMNKRGGGILDISLKDFSHV